MKIFNKLKKIAEFSLFPKNYKCLICAKDIDIKNDICLCDSCLNHLPLFPEHHCVICGETLNTRATICMHCKKYGREFDLAYAVFQYRDEIALLIQNLKYNNAKYIAPTLSKYLCLAFENLKWNIDYIIPVPLFKDKEKLRGYNQSELLCTEFKKSYPKIQIRNDILIRIIDTAQQADLSRSERKKNMLNAFKVINRRGLSGKNILLVDDVFTTGSTVEECARVLKNAGANLVLVLTVAHAITEETAIL